MGFKEQIVLLKNKKSVTIRETRIADTPFLKETIKTYLKDSVYIPIDSDEFNPSIAEGNEWIEPLISMSNSLCLVAIYEDSIIGNLELTGNKRRSMYHTAQIGMGMLKEWRNIGLGSNLMTCSIDWAIRNEELELLWLQVYTDNISAIKLYEKKNFTSNGVMRNFFKQGNQYFDNLTMSLNVNKN